MPAHASGSGSWAMDGELDGHNSEEQENGWEEVPDDLDEGSDIEVVELSQEVEAGGNEELEEETAQLAKLDKEIKDVESQISKLQSFRSTLKSDRSTLASSLLARRCSKPIPSNSRAKVVSKAAVDYSGQFPWSAKAKSIAKDVFGIDNFRLEQESAINASMDGREIVCVMPTGGGKSLIYQLPALLTPGTTLVITPLISLMQDQTYNLRQNSVRAEMLNSATSKEDAKMITARMVNGGKANVPKGKGKGKGKGKDIKPMKKEVDWDAEEEEDETEEDEREIKLVYVTPERIDKSKTFLNALQKMVDSDLLARIVIDEAHCVSSLGHDYRPAFLQLSKLHSMFPKVPIIGLTATAPAKVVQDMLKILLMPKTTSPGRAALPGTTVLFTSPLYRPNLHYSVISKPTSAASTILEIVTYIQENHPNQCGIVYCLSRADTENVAKGIREQSDGSIRAAVYHANIEDGDKLRVHKLWREKKLDVICATSAFGLGIDAPNVRFVIHHCLSKSLEGYYQESGRAGRDGADSDCVIFYRSADASRLSTLIYGEFFSGGREKLYEMVSFAEDLRTCRKIAFARYFVATHESKAAFESKGANNDPCGHCDNCTRDEETIESIDISTHAYRALRILSAASEQSCTLTLAQAVDLVRGLGGGKFSTQGGKGKKGSGVVDVVQEAGGKVTLSKDETESMLMRLLLEGYLREEFHATAYTTLSYIRPTNRAVRFTRLTPDAMEENGLDVELRMDVLALPATKSKRKGSPVSKPRAKKARPSVVLSEEDEEGEEEFKIQHDISSDGREVDSEGWQVFPVCKGTQSKLKREVEVLELDSD